MAYVVFISENLQLLVGQLFGLYTTNIVYFGIICFAVLTPMVWVRRIQAFAYFHVFADLTVLWTVGLLVAYAAIAFRD